MSENSEISLRAYQPGDEDGIAELLRDNYPNTPDIAAIRAMWLWQFRNEISRNSCVALAEMNGRLVGHYAVMWLEMTYCGQPIQGAISTATVTDKSVRGRGVFVKLALKAYENLAADDCRLVFGFPNSQSIHGFVTKLNWQEPGQFPVFVKPLRTRPFLARKFGNGALSALLGGVADAALALWSALRAPATRAAPIRWERVQQIPDEATALWASSFGASRIALQRDRRYLDWRYLHKPGFQYQIFTARSEARLDALAVCRIENKLGLRMMYVMELLIRDDDAVVATVVCAQLTALAKREGVDAISLLVLPGDPLRTRYERFGFMPVPRRFFPQDIYFGAMANSPDIDKQVLGKDHNWYISWGDLDVV